MRIALQQRNDGQRKGTSVKRAFSADWNKVLQMSPLEIQVTSDDKSGEIGDDGSCNGDAEERELEAMRAAVLRFGRAEKASRLGTTFFTGEIPENKVGGTENTSSICMRRSIEVGCCKKFTLSSRSTGY